MTRSTKPSGHRRKRVLPLTKLLSNPLDLEAHAPYRIAVLSNLLVASRYLPAGDKPKMGLREVRVLLNIGSYAPIKATDVSYQTRLDPFTVSRGVGTLQKAGLVTTEDDHSDRRGQILLLTPAGKAIYKQISQSLKIRAKKLLDALTPQEQTSLFEMLDRLEDRAEEILSDNAEAQAAAGHRLTADQREILRWRKRGR